MPSPNVVLILVDDMGYGDFGVFGDGSARTPVLDELVGDGVCLTQHYSASAVCAPARAALLTGRYPHRTGAIDTPEGPGLHPLAVRDATLPDRFTEEAVAFIERHRRGPFFLHLAYNAPHFPFQAPEEDVRPFRETGRFTTALSTLYGMIARMDAGVGRLLEALDRLGLRENTVVLFTSDNGPQWGGEGDQSIVRFNAGFRGHKGNVFEGGIRVPAILRWPAGLEGGRRVHEVIHFTDWLPTLLALAGLAPPAAAALDGRNVLPLLRGEPGDAPTTRFWQWNRYTPLVECNAAMRDGPWKLVRPAIAEALRVSAADLAMDRRLKYEPEGIADIERGPEPQRDVPPPPPPLLFNIADDPFEERDLAAAQPGRAAAMLRRLEGWFADVEAERRTIAD